MIRSSLIAATLASMLAGPALAAKVRAANDAASSKGTAAAVPATAATSAPASDSSSSLREGVIAELDQDAGLVMINGSWLKVAEGSTRIFRRGAEVNRSRLEAGQKVRFTMAPGAGNEDKLGVIYVP